MQTRQDLRNRAPVFTCSRPVRATEPTLFQYLASHAFFIGELVTALALGFIIHAVK